MRRYVDINGRLSRARYWQFILVAAIIAFVGLLLDDRLAVVLLAAHFLPFVTASVRRIHDSNQTGWLYWLVYVPVIGWVPFIGFMLVNGTAGPNRYGDEDRPEAPDVKREWSSFQQVSPEFRSAVTPEPSVGRFPADTTQTAEHVQRVSSPEESNLTLIHHLERLAALRASGALDEAEFARMKAGLIAKASAS